MLREDFIDLVTFVILVVVVGLLVIGLLQYLRVR